MPTHPRAAASVATALVLALAVAGCAASGDDKAGGSRQPKPIVLSMLVRAGAMEMQPFIDEVARLSGGSLRIEPDDQRPPGDVTEADLIRYVRSGVAPLGVIPARAWRDAGVTTFDALVAPLAIDSLALQQQVLSQSDLVDAMLDGVSRLGLLGLGVLPGPMQLPVGTTRELLKPADFAAARIAANSSIIGIRSLETLGASAVPFGFSGASIEPFDGIVQQVSSVWGNNYAGVATSITANVDLWPRPLVVVGNARALARLPRKYREVLRRAARSAVAATTSLQAHDERDAVAGLCREGKIRFVTADADQIAQLRRQLAPVESWLQRDPQTRKALSRIHALHASVAAAAAKEAPPSCEGVAAAAAAPVAGADTRLDGVYTLRTTAADLVAAHVPADLVVPENYGATTYVVDRGRFVFTQDSKQACTWSSGTWLVEGQQVTMTFADSGGIAPTHALNKPGEQFVFGWSLYHDVLSFTGVPGAVSPVPVKPWRRIDTKPSRDRLSTRCPPPAGSLPH